jgi:acetate kinase
MRGTVLALNAGSSSVKFALFTGEAEPRQLLAGQIEGIGRAPALEARDGNGVRLDGLPAIPSGVQDHDGLIRFLLSAVVAPRAGSCAAVGHRVVHGGTQFDRPVLLDNATITALDALSPLARLHQPHNLAGIRAARAEWPDVAQVACFDTAFHRTLPEARQVFGLPLRLAEAGVRRYGFHGLSYEAIASLLPDHLGALADGRVIVAHLGNGASLCGMVGRQSQVTTMGFTPLDGLVMGTRPGRLDAGVLLYLLGEKGLGLEALTHMLNRESGLLGLSGVSADMRDLLASEDERARLAVEVFVDRLAQEIGGAAAAIGGLDALVFTGGIGENAALIRARAIGRLAFLSARLDEAANARNPANIGAPDSAIRLLVLPTDEERQIARHALGVVRGG